MIHVRCARWRRSTAVAFLFASNPSLSPSNSNLIGLIKSVAGLKFDTTTTTATAATTTTTTTTRKEM